MGHDFVSVVESFAGTPLHYLSGDVRYINSLSSRWSENSRATVRTADVCVFVIIERFASITWETELREALDAGVLFLFLCLADTYRKYIDLVRSVESVGSIRDANDRSLVEALHETESVHQLTIVPFEHHQFADILRRHLALLFHEGTTMLKERSRRRALIPASLHAVQAAAERPGARSRHRAR